MQPRWKFSSYCTMIVVDSSCTWTVLLAVFFSLCIADARRAVFSVEEVLYAAAFCQQLVGAPLPFLLFWWRMCVYLYKSQMSFCTIKLCFNFRLFQSATVQWLWLGVERVLISNFDWKQSMLLFYFAFGLLFFNWLSVSASDPGK